ncbi:hypothetical protein EYR41_004773 [Orbilia oligospora]|uniref:Uncharacterized protein n=1 Tax=Orbilia oligospora TaxID=2813651 RepID=A0A8H2E1D1_ORBOL|nr:hypothetical protein TWF128_011356 [Orbilia oligospora]TGJ68682.1 hypothetical protein EYR41_004773 [Orbilia oligospora]
MSNTERSHISAILLTDGNVYRFHSQLDQKLGGGEAIGWNSSNVRFSGAHDQRELDMKRYLWVNYGVPGFSEPAFLVERRYRLETTWVQQTRSRPKEYGSNIPCRPKTL